MPKHLQFAKCLHCRQHKKKCLPQDREWPGTKCERCQTYDYECSEPISTRKRSGKKHNVQLRSQIKEPSNPTSTSETPVPFVKQNIEQVLLSAGDENTISAPAELPESKDTALHRAAWHGRCPAIKVRLERGDDVNAEDEDGETPLQRCAWNGHSDCGKLLLAAGATVNHTKGLYGSALEIASHRGHFEMVNTLIEHGASYENVALHAAVKGGHTSIVALLLEQCKDINQRILSPESTFLHAAARSGKPDVLRCILEAGGHTDIVAVNANAETPLHIAAGAGNEESFQLLLTEGADPYAISRSFGSVLHHACAAGHAGIIRILIEELPSLDLNERSLNKLALNVACHKGCEDVVELLIEHGADVNLIDVCTPMKGMCDTALATAIQCDHPEVALRLLQHGAKVNLSTSCNNDLPPLGLACKGGYTELVRAMIEQGADPDDRKNRIERSMIACTALGRRLQTKVPVLHPRTKEVQELQTRNQTIWDDGHVEVAKILLERNVDLASQNTYGHTPFIDALSSFHNSGKETQPIGREKIMDIMKLMVHHGAVVNGIVDMLGYSCLHIIIAKPWSYSSDMADFMFLLKHVTNIDQQDYNGRTPLMQASAFGRTLYVQQLLLRGANPNLTDNIGKTARSLLNEYIKRTPGLEVGLREYWNRRLQLQEEATRRKTALPGPQPDEPETSATDADQEENPANLDLNFDFMPSMGEFDRHFFSSL